MEKNKDYIYCKNIIKENSKSFYKAFSKLPKEKANAIFTVYAFCRTADDLIDLREDKEGLLLFKDELLLFSKGIVVDKPLWRALGEVFKNYDMDIKPFFQMIEGQLMDSDFKNIETQEELINYCYYVAGTVGLMILPILATSNHKELEEIAIKLGTAMQITNILRDIGEDFRRNRIYIPKEVMEKFNYSSLNLKYNLIDKNFINIWEFEAEIAENLYKEVYKKINLFDEDSKAAVILASILYKEILNSVRKQNYDCLTKRNYVGIFKKIFTVIQCNFSLQSLISKEAVI